MYFKDAFTYFNVLIARERLKYKHSFFKVKSIIIKNKHAIYKRSCPKSNVYKVNTQRYIYAAMKRPGS